MLFDIKGSSRPHLPHNFCQGEEIRVVRVLSPASYKRSKGVSRTFLFFCNLLMARRNFIMEGEIH